MTLARRSFITGLISLVAAPAIIRAGSLMPVKVMLPEPWLTSAVIFQDNIFWIRNDGAVMVFSAPVEPSPWAYNSVAGDWALT